MISVGHSIVGSLRGYNKLIAWHKTNVIFPHYVLLGISQNDCKNLNSISYQRDIPLSGIRTLRNDSSSVRSLMFTIYQKWVIDNRGWQDDDSIAGIFGCLAVPIPQLTHIKNKHPTVSHFVVLVGCQSVIDGKMTVWKVAMLLLAFGHPDGSQT